MYSHISDEFMVINDRIVKFRRAEEHDLPIIRNILGYYILNTTATWRYEVPDEYKMKQWFEQHNKPSRPIIVAVIEGMVVGYASLSDFRNGEGYWPCAENSVYLSQEVCGYGIGYKLMEILLRIAEQTELEYIIAGIDADNKSSIKFHRKLGYTESGTINNIGNKFGRNLDLLFMIKKLNK
ncbi:MAG: L-amino acid N-acyltransferase [Clostridiales bacterium]|jgi:phosphinothricin acetyltransferase|nr:L-amino acid N-acyltransferase [Clostridiales bacterium]